MKKSGREVEARDGEIPNAACSMFQTLAFRELTVGDQFICLPLPGDNDGHGSSKNTYYIFVKVNALFGRRENAVRLKDGIYSSMPDSMRVVKIE